jgi:hypothetical protein
MELIVLWKNGTLGTHLPCQWELINVSHRCIPYPVTGINGAGAYTWHQSGVPTTDGRPAGRPAGNKLTNFDLMSGGGSLNSGLEDSGRGPSSGIPNEHVSET